jgi:hypothetical protein
VGGVGEWEEGEEWEEWEEWEEGEEGEEFSALPGGFFGSSQYGFGITPELGESPELGQPRGVAPTRCLPFFAKID